MTGLLGLWVALANPAPAAEADLAIVAEDFDLSADTDRALRRVLNRMFRTYQDVLGLTFPNPTPVHVRLVADRAEYDRRARALGLSKPTLGFFSPQLGEGVVWKNTSDSEMRGTIIHEASHYLLAVAGVGRVPLWMNEGLAETFETARASGNAVYLDPAPGMSSWLQRNGGSLPSLEVLLADPRAWSGLSATPVGGPEYGVGWSICAFLMSSAAGKRTLSEMLLRAGSGDASGVASAVEETWTGGASSLDRAWRAWIAAGPSSIQLPIPSDAGAGDGWRKCANGTLIREGSGMTCGQWVAGPDGMMRWVEE